MNFLKYYLLNIVVSAILFALFPIDLLADDMQDEPHTPIIWSVSFEGNESYSRIVLRDIIAARSPNFIRKFFRRVDDYQLNENELRRDRIRIIRYYERRGYDQVQVNLDISEGDREWKKHVVFQIREGAPIRITSSNVIIEADSTIINKLKSLDRFDYASRQHRLREGQRYQTVRIPDVEGRFTEIMQNHGHPWAETKVEADIDSLAKSADVRIVLNPGPLSYFTNFHFEGVESVPERIVKRQMNIDEEEVYDIRKVQEAQRQIFGHHLFRFATITLPDQERDSTLDMRIRVRENPLRTVQATVGFGSEDLFRGQLSWQHRNINRTGHRLGFNARGSFIEQRVGADYLIPYIFNPKSRFVAAPYAQRRLEPAFELLKLGISNSLVYQHRRTETVSASYEFSINELLSRREHAELPDTVLDFNVSSLFFTGYYSESTTREPEGWVIQPSIELSSTFGEATHTFQRITLDVRHFYRATGSTTLAGRINAGAIFTREESLPTNIRFFTGGTNTVRGWSRQMLGPKRPAFEAGQFDEFVPTGGRALFTFNAELRQKLDFLFSGFGIGLFLDGGQVWRTIDSLDERPLQFGTGGGFRYQSPIGPVRIDVGYKINPTEQDLNQFGNIDRGSNWDRIGIHLSIGQAF